MWGVFVREYARAASLSNDVVVLHLIENDTQVKKAWLIEPELDPELTFGIDTIRIRIGSRLPSPIRYLNSMTSTNHACRHLIDNINFHDYQCIMSDRIVPAGTIAGRKGGYADMQGRSTS
jgi:hypothetical protein